MATKIEWATETWNPTTGCTKISPGCAHCYIERQTPMRVAGRRFVRGKIPIVLHPERLTRPLHWRTPRRVFVDSMSDLFHEDVPDAFIDAVFCVMAICGSRRQRCRGSRCQHGPESTGCWMAGDGREEPTHIFQVLTKRPERMRAWLGASDRRARIEEAARAWTGFTDAEEIVWAAGWPLPNVWLGVTTENQRMADERIPLLLDTPAAVRFLSCEPLLGPVYLRRWLGCDDPVCDCRPWLDWVIVGGESGPKARPMELTWARSIVAQCKAAGVPVFMKQLGGRYAGTPLEKLPDDLRVREYPA